MGIQGLERYLLTHHDACPTVSIADLVKEYKEKTGRSEAVAVVDGGMLTYHVMGRLDLLLGGQFKEFAEGIVAFARRLQGVGAAPVFFFKGVPSKGRLSTWSERKRKEHARAVAVYARLQDTAQRAGDSQVVTEPQPEVSEVVTEPQPEVNVVVTEPQPEVNEVVTEPQPEVNEVVTEPQPEVSQVVTEPQPEVNEVVTEPQLELNEVVTEPQPEANEAVTKPQPEVNEAVTIQRQKKSDQTTNCCKNQRENVNQEGRPEKSLGDVRPSAEAEGEHDQGAVLEVAVSGLRLDSADCEPLLGSAPSHQVQPGSGGGRGRGCFAPRGRGAVRGRRVLTVRDQPAHQTAGHGNLLPPGTHDCALLALKMAGFEVRLTVDEFDVEVARFARRESCFCILSRDTDYVAMEGALHYLSLGHLDEQAMTTVLFDRDAIARALGLRHRQQLPLLLALLPNGCVPAPYLIPLHLIASGGRKESLSPKLYFRVEKVVQKLGELVRKDLWGKSVEEAAEIVITRALASYPKETLNRFSRELKFADRWALRESLRVQLEASLRGHDYTPPASDESPAPKASPVSSNDKCNSVDSEVLELALARHRGLRFASPWVLTLLLRRVIELNPVLEDPTLPPHCGSATALLAFRRRAYGVLFKGSVLTNEDPLVVREFILSNALPSDGQLQPTVVYPNMPEDVLVPHPGLKALWSGEDHAASAWRLFVWCLCPALLSSSESADELVGRLRALPPALALPAAAMFLLRHSGAVASALSARPGAGLCNPGVGTDVHLKGASLEVLSEDDILQLIARTCVVAGRLSAAEIGALPKPRCVRLAVHIAALFMRTWSYLVVLNDILGNPVPVDKLYPPDFFDGKLWQCMFSGSRVHQMNIASHPPPTIQGDQTAVTLRQKTSASPEWLHCEKCFGICKTYFAIYTQTVSKYFFFF
ncbi:uncharacterized protein LOC113212294 isoform X2 [Frankliniella occidentalis]|uniref:Uncharacterized protein LOC113212294 isoform X2 n=1 Tax=Frankliniella occidentalis TaxID=133901 RepID=A0A9C6X208_FRAOC|nr:uncharacterized protein LOC113212294 isoform X2 [Frankliniella occidentalis]